jgi:hypothetical protein
MRRIAAIYLQFLVLLKALAGVSQTPSAVSTLHCNKRVPSWPRMHRVDVSPASLRRLLFD